PRTENPSEVGTVETRDEIAASAGSHGLNSGAEVLIAERLVLPGRVPCRGTRLGDRLRPVRTQPRGAPTQRVVALEFGRDVFVRSAAHRPKRCEQRPAQVRVY